MSTPRRPAGNQGQRPWIPMKPATLVLPPALAARAATDPSVAALVESGAEIWRNDRYICTVRRNPEGHVFLLSIRRADHKPAWDWRHLQIIKNEIAGEDVEGFQIHPARDRTVDTANQYWIWCLPPGVRIPAGFSERSVGEDDPEFPDSVQRPFAPGEDL